MRLTSALIGVCVGVFAVSLLAQAPDERLAFEVASIKADDLPFTGGSAEFRPGGTFVANVPAWALVDLAFYRVVPFLPGQVIGLPEWANVTRYNITAKVPASEANDLSPERRAAFVRSLLEDRFAFKAHMETRELAVYVLTIAPGGPKINPTQWDCSKPEDTPKCGIHFGAGHVTGSETMVNVMGTLAGAVQRPIVDHTNLQGRFDVDLSWNATNDPASDQPSIFTAVQDQLGLKLESSRAPVDVLVIDHIEKPTED